ncbi:hypothetical protein ACCD06_17780 [Azospirillum sp. CT11-132]|uniref:hypothetical protein n=1 Tax=Azospirillum sp. CT11-132 TaxID=3396317 RepID=UPI0039A40CB8
MKSIDYMQVTKLIDERISVVLKNEQPKNPAQRNGVIKSAFSKMAADLGIDCRCSQPKGRGEFMVDVCWLERDKTSLIPTLSACHMAGEIELNPYADMKDMYKLLLMKSPLKVYVHSPAKYMSGTNVLRFVRAIQDYNQHSSNEIYHFMEISKDNRVVTTATYIHEERKLSLGIEQSKQFDEIMRRIGDDYGDERDEVVRESLKRRVPTDINFMRR